MTHLLLQICVFVRDESSQKCWYGTNNFQVECDSRKDFFNFRYDLFLTHGPVQLLVRVVSCPCISLCFHSMD